HLLGEGRHEELWKVLGAHVRTFPAPGGDIAGTSFAVWAPSARGVRVSGDFNGWNSVAFPMRTLGDTGVWELFIPGVGNGAKYKYDVLGADSVWRGKADPLAQHTEHPPATASVVYTSDYDWNDGDWCARRSKTDWLRAPMSTGSPSITRQTSSSSRASRGRRFTTTPSRVVVSSPTGAPTSSTSAGARSATSSSRTPATGSRSSTSTGCASTPSRRCSTSTTRARKASGSRTSSAGGRTSTRSSSSRR